jgi:hypothetical protein
VNYLARVKNSFKEEKYEQIPKKERIHTKLYQKSDSATY